MKNFSFLFMFILLTGSLFLISCENEETVDGPADPSMLTIAEYASGSEDFSILVDALDKTELTATLNGQGNFTVFAPDNDAFTALFEKLGISGVDDISVEGLRQILLYHLIDKEIPSDMITDGYYSSMSPAQGRTVSMYLSTDGGVMINRNTSVIAADINVSNGVLHAIDKVILPPNVVDLAEQNGNFTTLVSAVTGAGLGDVLADASGTFTIFAPTDEAFAALDGNLPSDLSPILLYHVMGSPVFKEQINSSVIRSLNSTDPEIIVEVNDNGVLLNGKANVIVSDIVGTNGVIHVIDEVIMPINNNSIIDIAMGMSDKFSSLVAALAKTNLASKFMRDGEYTVFAPTNDAFASYLESVGIGFDDLSAEDLVSVLKYHVLGLKVMSTDLKTGYVNTIYEAIEGNPVSMLVELENGVILNNSVSVTMADVAASNGVVHVTDKVLTPTTVVDIVINNNSFTNLVQAVVRAGLVETLSGEGPFTIFAPTDEAFAATLSNLGLSSVDDIAANDLVPILQYHVVSGNVKSTDLSNGMVMTLNGEINVSIDDSPMINGDTEILATDIQGTNGVVHVINKVLIP